jgi:hypothetical protein
MCLFNSYVKNTLDNNFEGSPQSFMQLARRCTCRDCKKIGKSLDKFNKKLNKNGGEK